MTKYVVLTLLIALSNSAFAQENDLLKIVNGLRDNVIERVNNSGHRLNENTPVLTFFDGKKIDIKDLENYSLSEIKEIALKFDSDPKTEVIYGDIVRYGVIYIVSKMEKKVKNNKQKFAETNCSRFFHYLPGFGV